MTSIDPATPPHATHQNESKPRQRITQAQKQMLINNLQLEITERARKLRAQYALQAQGLRNRIEIRVNRVPTALRKITMGELLEKHAKRPGDEKKDAISVPVPAEPSTAISSKPVTAGNPSFTVKVPQSRISEARARPESPKKGTIRQIPTPRSRGMKRSSAHLEVQGKENEATGNDLNIPKKRAKTGTAPGPATAPNNRALSRTQMQPSQVLSPRSANSRTLPQSPVRQTAPPAKPQFSRPNSSMKTTVPAPSSAAAKADKSRTMTRTAGRKVTPAASTSSTATTTGSGAGRGRRTPAPPAAPPSRAGRGRASNSSETSTSTTSTVVNKAKKAPTTTRKPPVPKAPSATGSIRKVPTTTAKPDASGTGTAKRTLRKRV